MTFFLILQYVGNARKWHETIWTVFSKRSNCSASKIFISSAQVSSNRVFDINLKSVHAACNGSGYTGFKRLFIIGPSTASDRKKHLTIY